jgi:hypothetical protein
VLTALKAAGATVIQLDGPNADVSPAFTFPVATGETFVLDFDFKGDVQSYFATRVGVPVAGGTLADARTLADAIAFDNANADAEMPFWGQEIFIEAQALLPGANTPQTDPNLGVPVGTTYNQALAIDRQPGLVDRPAVRRSLRVRQLGARCSGRLSVRAGAGCQRLRHPVRADLLRHRIQRAEADHAGIRLRGRNA